MTDKSKNSRLPTANTSSHDPPPIDRKVRNHHPKGKLKVFSCRGFSVCLLFLLFFFFPFVFLSGRNKWIRPVTQPGSCQTNEIFPWKINVCCTINMPHFFPLHLFGSSSFSVFCYTKVWIHQRLELLIRLQSNQFGELVDNKSRYKKICINVEKLSISQNKSLIPYDKKPII